MPLHWHCQLTAAYRDGSWVLALRAAAAAAAAAATPPRQGLAFAAECLVFSKCCFLYALLILKGSPRQSDGARGPHSPHLDSWTSCCSKKTPLSSCPHPRPPPSLKGPRSHLCRSCALLAPPPVSGHPAFRTPLDVIATAPRVPSSAVPQTGSAHRLSAAPVRPLTVPPGATILSPQRAPSEGGPGVVLQTQLKPPRNIRGLTKSRGVCVWHPSPEECGSW